ncbi:MAG: hypothetical protein AAB975_01640, partial [Patescibacteria group bacterium]
PDKPEGKSSFVTVITTAMKLTTVILIIITLIGLSTVGFFFFKNRTLVSENMALEGRLSLVEQELTNLEDKKAETETELAVLKATDFTKETEVSRLKIKKAESDLAVAEKKLAKFETNLSRIKPYKEVLATIDQFFGRPPIQANLENIDSKIRMLADSQINVQWTPTKADLTEYINTGSWGTREVVHILYLIVFKIRGLAL